MRSILASAAIAASFLTPILASVPAHAVIENRPQCYTAVTTACNKRKSAEGIAACNENGHDQCDEQFPKSEAVVPPTRTPASLKVN